MLEVSIVSANRVIFGGKCKSIIFPGEKGVFEVLPFHKKLLSILIEGDIEVDGKPFSVLKGIVKISDNTVTAVVEEDIESINES